MALETDYTPEGPIWFGGNLTTQTTDENGRSYSIKWLPDKNNPSLRENGEPMKFYYLLDRSRLATDEDGHYKFHLQKFAGIMDPNVNVGAPGYSEVNGGFLSFTTTMKIPETAMEAAKEELKEKIENQYGTNPLLNWNSDLPEPDFDNVPIVDNETKLHTVSRRDEGAGSGGENVDDDNIPPWGWDVQGTGKGSLNPVGTNAYSALLGQYPVQLIEGAAESGESNLVVENHLTYNINSPVAKISVSGDWSAIFDHFSTAASGSAYLSEVDIEHEMEKMEREGTIEVEIDYNEEFVDQEEVDKWESAAEEIRSSFMTMAKETVLTKDPPDVESASAEDPAEDSKNPYAKWFPTGELSVTSVENEETLELDYSKEINKRVNRKSVQSTSITGLFDELQENEDAKDRYFSEVRLDEGWKKIHVIGMSNANWGSGEEDGDPIHHIECEIGYPNSSGDVQYVNEARFRDSQTATEVSEQSAPAIWDHDQTERAFVWDFLREDDVENPEEIHVRKRVSFDQGDEYVLAEEVVDEWQTTEKTVEVRAENPGHLEVGPITVDMPLDNENVSVFVTLKADDVPNQRLRFTADDPGPKYWDVWYPPGERPSFYEYKAQAVVEPPYFGLEELRWPDPDEGESLTWQRVEGDGPIEIDVPAATERVRGDLKEYLSGGD
jgi:hypothetical protein